jgi:LysM repeat protein
MDEYNTQAAQDRRIQNIPVTDERRKLMPLYESADAHTRISVLEVKVLNTDDRLEETQRTTNKLVERLDTHIQASTLRDANMQAQLIKVSDSVMNLAATVTDTNVTLKEIAKQAGASHMQLMKWDTIVMTVLKVGSVLSLAAGAFWTVYTYMDSRQVEKPALIQPYVQGK